MEPEVVIIGAGPAGMTAAMQLARYGIPLVLLERERVGGLLWNANLVENYPGFPAGISGPKLVGLFEKQLQWLGVTVTFEGVERLEVEAGQPVVTAAGKIYRPRFVVVASGTKPRPIPLEIPPSAAGRVFSDVIPLLGVREKRIVIIGAGDAAFDHALNLAKERNYVTILNRGVDVKCLALLRERARAEKNITYLDETAIRALKTVETSDSLRVVCERPGARFELEADFIVYAIGREPQLGFIPAPFQAENIILIGDARNGSFRQTAIAAGDGLRAAMQIYQYLRGGEI
jgi:thioredoxin reductase